MFKLKPGLLSKDQCKLVADARLGWVSLNKGALSCSLLSSPRTL